MAAPTRIHGGKQTFRRHFIKEWMAERNMKPMDLARALNAPESDDPYIDKSQVYKWLKGQLPHKETQVRIAAALGATDPYTGEPDPEALLRHPAQDWIARKLQNREPDEIKRARQAIDAVLPDRTGTD